MVLALALGIAQAQTSSPVPIGPQQPLAEAIPGGLPAGVPTGFGVQKPIVVVVRFAAASQSVAEPSTLSSQACPRTNSSGVATDNATATPALRVDPQLLDAISEHLLKKFSKKTLALVEADAQSVPMGALIVSGCVTRADAGNAAERIVGMNLGASYLGAHVRIFSKAESGLMPVDEFDVQAKGGQLLPPLGPIGLATRAASAYRDALSADAEKLANQIWKKLAQTLKSQEPATKSASAPDSLHSSSALALPPDR
jgi:hypothetical protein